MWRTVRRLYYYLATSFSLLYMAIVLQNVLHDVLLRAGLTDITTLPELLDLFSNLPIFTDIKVDIGVFIFGVAHWFLLHHDAASSGTEGGGLIRAFFLSALTTAFGIRIVFELILIVHNTDNLSGQTTLPIAAPLAAVLAWTVALGLVQLKWHIFGGPSADAERKIAKFFALLGQWILAVVAIWAIAQAIQSALQQVIAPLPHCSSDLNIAAQFLTTIARLSQQCTDTPPLLGAGLIIVVVSAAMAIYTLWGARYESAGLSNLDAIIGMLITGITITLNSAIGIRLALDAITRHPDTAFPQSLLSTPSAPGITSYPFIGPLIAGFCALLFYGWRQIRRRDEGEGEGLAYAIITLSIPLALVLFTGASLLLGHAFSTILHNRDIVEPSVSQDDWSFGLMLLIPGLLGGLALWRDLKSIGSGGPSDPLPSRIYVWGYFLCTSAVAIISLVIFIGLVVTAWLHTPLDPTNYFAPHMIAITLVTASAAVYYRDLKEQWG